MQLLWSGEEFVQDMYVCTRMHYETIMHDPYDWTRVGCRRSTCRWCGRAPGTSVRCLEGLVVCLPAPVHVHESNMHTARQRMSSK